MYYVIRWKGHYENWNDNITYSGLSYNYYFSLGGLKASNGQYTVKSYSLPIKNGEIDFQVKAQIGYSFTYFGGHIQPIGTLFQADAESNWSNTQTVTILEGSVSTPNPSPIPTATPLDATTPTDTNSDNSVTSLLTSLALVAIAILTVVVISLLLYVSHLKRSTAKPENSTVLGLILERYGNLSILRFY